MAVCLRCKEQLKNIGVIFNQAQGSSDLSDGSLLFLDWLKISAALAFRQTVVRMYNYAKSKCQINEAFDLLSTTTNLFFFKGELVEFCNEGKQQFHVFHLDN